jgi:hypothetical protein
MRRALLLIGALLLAGCLEPVRTVPPAGDTPTDDPGKFDRPAENAERCDNGLDDDANGQVDEGCPCSPGDVVDCYLGAPETREVGACTSGTMTCESDGSNEFGGYWGRCEGAYGPSAETCNGEDDDCNGAVDDANDCSDAECWNDSDCGSDRTCAQGVCVGTGALRFTLVWDRPGDIDLHVLTPAGNEISFRSLEADGGQLDRDDRDGTGPENVFWDAAPPGGRYYVCVVPFNVHEATGYTLTIENDGDVQTETGTVDSIADSYGATCDAQSPFLVAEASVR